MLAGALEFRAQHAQPVVGVDVAEAQLTLGAVAGGLLGAEVVLELVVAGELGVEVDDAAVRAVDFLGEAVDLALEGFLGGLGALDALLGELLELVVDLKFAFDLGGGDLCFDALGGANI